MAVALFRVSRLEALGWLCQKKRGDGEESWRRDGEQHSSKQNFILILSFVLLPGAGFDGVEEIKRHPFFVTIDWNVSLWGFFLKFSWLYF